MGYRVLVLHSYCSDTDGSSIALKGYLADNSQIEFHKVLTMRNDGITGLNVKEVKSSKDVLEELNNEKYDLIHFYKLGGYELFRWTIHTLDKLGLETRIVTTINQRPSFKGLWFSPLELRRSSVIVFIDHTAYNDPLLDFIDEEMKECIYYTTSSGPKALERHYTKRLEHRYEKDNVIVFGRGSTLCKCPQDMIAEFEAIPYENKEFHIVGVSDDSWVAKQARKYDNVKTWPIQRLEDWYEILSEFDVFLYHIPDKSHSSLDGTLGAAMLMAIPVVYCGAEAPKERFEHGVNGFVAETRQEIVEYCQMLAEDKELRIRIGEAGRNSTLEKFSWKKTVESYNRLYRGRSYKHISVPLSYTAKFYFYNSKELIKEIIINRIKRSSCCKFYRYLRIRR